MVYKMVMHTDGGCRRNGYSNAIGAAACIIIGKHGQQERYFREIPSYEDPTSQRAELTALIIALQQAKARYEGTIYKPYMKITIYTDSKYAHGCITDWIHKWLSNDWINAKGQEVKNRDLIEEASELDDYLRDVGDVTYTWVPRSKNIEADELCNQVLDDME